MGEEEVNIRFMDLEDLDQVMEVEKNCFPTPWSRGAFQSELTTNQFAYYLIAVSGERVVGYIGVWIIIDEAHITNIAVHSDARNQGIGNNLLRAVMEFSKTLGAKKLTLEVRVTNESAKSMYIKNGFINGGIRKNYYTDNQEDAQIMWVVLE